MLDAPSPPKVGKQVFFDHPVFGLGFRPFYLLAAAFAAASVPLWVARYFGWIDALPNVGLVWHAHEMIFGFIIAVIVGFLYTAGRNWTGLWTPTKGHLAALAALWLAGRIAMLTSAPLLAAAVDVLFLPLAAWPLFRVLQKSGSKRNIFVVVILALLAFANAIFHGAVLGWLSLSPIQPVYAAILVVVVLETVIAGRIIPGFTTNVIPEAKSAVNIRHDQISMGVTVTACIAWILGLPAPLTALLALAAAFVQLVRLAGWKPYMTLAHPLLWILHLSYAWIPVGFILLAMSAFNQISQSAALHVLAIGATSGLIIGMMTRTALGHTGRKLKPGKSEVAMYLLIQAGAMLRLVAAVQTDGTRDAALMLAAVAWTGAFLLYLVTYGPYLITARIDGKDG